VKVKLSSKIEFVCEEDAFSKTGTLLAAVDYVFQCEGKSEKVRVTQAAKLTLDFRQKGASPRVYAEYFLRDRISQRGFPANETITLSANGMEHLVSNLKINASS
jgi:hypothetical protein